MSSPWIGDFDGVALSTIRRTLLRFISKVYYGLLVDIHWKELVISFHFKFALVNVQGGNSYGSPRLIAIVADIVLDGGSLPSVTYCLTTLGEILHSLHFARWVNLYLFSGFSANPG